MRISDWSSDVCSSDLLVAGESGQRLQALNEIAKFGDPRAIEGAADQISEKSDGGFRIAATLMTLPGNAGEQAARDILRGPEAEQTNPKVFIDASAQLHRSEEHTSELQSLMRISYAVFCLKKKNNTQTKCNRQLTR